VVVKTKPKGPGRGAPPGVRYGGRKPTDPAKLAARGAYRDNPVRAPKGFAPHVDKKKMGIKPAKPKDIPEDQIDEVVFPNKDFVGIALKYCNDVVNGAIPACQGVVLSCKRHLEDLKKSDTDPAYPYFFDDEAANRFCAAAELYPHVKGKWALRAQRLDLGNWQCFILACAFGWKRRKDGRRRFREMYVFVPRKNGKSMLAAAIGNNMLLIDEEHGAEVYSGATSEKQAWEVFGPARLMILNSPSLRAQYGIEVWAKALVKDEDNSKFWPLIGKPGDGASPHCAIIDEYHEHASSDMVDTMTTGMGAREQPMLLIITTAGTDLASPCYDKHLEAIRVLQGQAQNEELFTVMYGIDEQDDWTNPEMLKKANPNYGVSVDEDFLTAQHRQAMQNSAYQNRFKTKHLNVWCNASVAGINSVDWDRCKDESLKPDQFRGESVFVSLDLASKVDICCKAQVFKRRVNGDNHYYAFIKSYLPEDTIEEATKNKQTYQKWVIDGHLVATPGAEVDFDQVREDVINDASIFQIQEITYDPWRATQLAHQLQKDGAKVVEVGQTAKNMAEAYDELLTSIKARRFHHNGDPVLAWMAANVVSKSVAKGLVVPSKDRPENKIDGIVAIVMAISRAMTIEVGGWLMNPLVVQ
jgi:phage terminase large subunit-like protein